MTEASRQQELNVDSTRHFRWRLVAVILILGGWELLAWGAARQLIVEAPLSSADAIVVLSGSATAWERALLAAELYRNGRARRIILSNDNRQGGWSSAQQRNPFFYEISRDELQRLGVPEEAIEVLMRPVTSTYDEALAFQIYARENGLRSIVIVTSGYHSRRALWTFNRVFSNDVEVGLIPVKPGIQTPGPATWWLRPSGWQMVPGEYAKLIYYRLRS